VEYAELGGKSRVLDAGVGMGRLLSMLPENINKYGMDISIDYLKAAREKGIDVCMAMIEDMPYEAGSFDMVICTDVLEHVLDLNKVCVAILNVLKVGGMLIVRVPYREELDAYLSPQYSYHYAHLRNFDENSITLLFEKVFKCKVLACAASVPVVQANLLKFRMPGLLERGLHMIVRFVSKLNKGLYILLRGWLYKPCIMNCVVLKQE
jgi:SAM-dependent methyltransferase